MKGRKGFTLMELMIVIAIIMILSAAIVARITTGTEKAKYAKANGEMAEIAAAVRAFYMDTGGWPYNNTAAAYTSAVGDAGLISKDNILAVVNESGAGMDLNIVKAKWKGPYLETMEWPLDPWGSHRYRVIYRSDAPRGLYVLCHGPNLQSDGLNWNTGKVDEGSDSILLLVHRF